MLHAIGLSGLLDQLKSSNESLDKVIKGLENFLEEIRLLFPRFFFLSNDDMLDILSKTKDPERMQPHLKKCFDGINKLSFELNLDVSAMISSDGEKVVI